jgi:hypothetical protein
VGKAATSVVASDASGDVGAPASVWVSVTSPATAKPTGTVTVLDGTTQVGTGTLSGGAVTVSVDTTGMAVGDHTLTVQYGGADNFASSSKDITLTLSKAASTVTAADQSATYGSAGAVTASVSGAANPGGAVTFSEGATTLGQANVGSDSTATLALPEVTLGAGTHTITAAYGGSGTLDASSTTFTLTVAKAATSVVASNASGTEGSSVSVPVTVTSSATGKPTGTVTVLNGTTQVGSGTLSGGAVTVSVNTSSLHTGANSLTVKYGGADNFATSSKDITVTITAAKKTATVTAPDVSVGYGHTVSLPITVKGAAGTPTGQVRVLYGSKSLGTVTLNGGKAKLTIPAKSLAPGRRALSLQYGGNAVYAAATGTATVTVTKAIATITDEVRDGPIKVRTSGPKLYVRVSASGVTPTGEVTLLIGAKRLTGTLAGGQVTIKLPTFSNPGRVSVTIQYGGDDDVHSATKKITLTVHRK